MSAFSMDMTAKAREMNGDILRRLAERTQTAVAEEIGLTDTKLCRMK